MTSCCSKLVLLFSSLLMFITVRIEAADVCADVITNCKSYGQSACVNYQDWAKANCNYTCQFCQGPPPQKPCVDNRNDCDQYISDICTSSSFQVWAEDNCSKYCGFCSTTSPTAATTVTTVDVKTTKAPVQTTPKANTPCADSLNYCLVFSINACNDVAWADKYCKKYCSRC